jgi:hypothetical protein
VSEPGAERVPGAASEPHRLRVPRSMSEPEPLRVPGYWSEPCTARDERAGADESTGQRERAVSRERTARAERLTMNLSRILSPLPLDCDACANRINRVEGWAKSGDHYYCLSCWALLPLELLLPAPSEPDVVLFRGSVNERRAGKVPRGWRFCFTCQEPRPTEITEWGVRCASCRRMLERYNDVVLSVSA